MVLTGKCVIFHEDAIVLPPLVKSEGLQAHGNPGDLEDGLGVPENWTAAWIAASLRFGE